MYFTTDYPLTVAVDVEGAWLTVACPHGEERYHAGSDECFANPTHYVVTMLEMAQSALDALGIEDELTRDLVLAEVDEAAERDRASWNDW